MRRAKNRGITAAPEGADEPTTLQASENKRLIAYKIILHYSLSKDENVGNEGMKSDGTNFLFRTMFV
jgi:hypothetical protein